MSSQNNMEYSKEKKKYSDTLQELRLNTDIKPRKRKDLEDNKCDPVKNGHVSKQVKFEDGSQDWDMEEKRELSEYEKMVRKNIEEKNAFFAAMNFGELMRDFNASTSVSKPKPKPKHVKKELPTCPVRRSPRLLKISSDVQSIQPQPVKNEVVRERVRKPYRPLTFQETFMLEDSRSEELVKAAPMLAKGKINFEQVPFDRYVSYFNDMKTGPSFVAKVAPSRIFALALHPSIYKTLVCVGSKHGHVSFWDVKAENLKNDIYSYQPHSSPVSCIAFNMSKPCEVVSCDYDGTVRCGNIAAGVFYEVFHTEDDDIRCTNFDFLTPSSVLVSLSSGNVVVADMRTGKQELSHRSHSGPVKTVNVHPVKKEYFLAAGKNGLLNVWDIRFLKRKPVADLNMSRCIYSAYFSPVTGNSVVATVADNKLWLLDYSKLKEKLLVKNTIRHNNFVGRWLTPFQARWLPGNEDGFIIGSINLPRQIEVYHTRGSLVHTFKSEYLTTVCSAIAFHHVNPILAGANSSGKVYIFQSGQSTCE